MNSKRIIFWAVFIVVLGLIIWGLVVAMNKPMPGSSESLGTPAPVTSADHVRGNPDAPVTLIEYSDFQCPACRSYHPLIERLMTEASTTVRLVYRHFPLPQHQNAELASQASEAAGVQGKFWDMYHLLFENQDDFETIPDGTAVFAGYASKLGLNMEQYARDLASSTLKTHIDAEADEGRTIGIDHTPTFFVNGKVIDNPQSYDEFKAVIDKAASTRTP